jgi:hypothetical protein
MASFPDSIFSPASKNTGDTIQASHVTDLDNEVVALEQGLRNGTAPLNSSNSTFAALSVAGDSTFTGSVTFSSRVNFRPAAIRLTHSTLTELANNTFAGLSWDTEGEDAFGMHSTSANSSRITFADSTGLYHVGASVEFAASTVGARMVRLVLNDAQGIGSQIATQESIVAGAPIPLSVSALVRASDTTDYVTVQAYQNTGSTLSVQNSTLHRTQFWAYKVSL